MRFASLLLGTANVSAEERSPRVIGGSVAGPNDLAFVVALMSCTGTSCYRFCTGSLIAPNVVLTAAHCVRDRFSPFSDQDPNKSAASVKVLMGNKSATSLETAGRLVQVIKIKFAHYGTNVRFLGDGDIALLELDECVAAVAGKIEFAAVATYNSDPVGGLCQSVNVAGFGVQSNAPDPLKDEDHKLRYIVDKLHSGQQCRDAYVALVTGRAPPNIGAANPQIVQSIIPDMYICTGGVSPHSVCFGDSGGPTFVYLPDGRAQVIGITSFGFGGQNFCTVGPDFSTRVSIYAAWIRNTIMRDFASCAEWEVAESFASWPVRTWNADMVSTEFKNSRCGTDGLHWQCSDGQCIDDNLVCDGANTCTDGSDETYVDDGVDLCDARRRRDVSGKSNRLPTLFAIDESVERVVGPVVKATTCTAATNNVVNAVEAAKASNTLGLAVWDTSELESVCTSLAACSTDATKGTDTYKSAVAFCSELEDYLTNLDQSARFASIFGAQMGAACPDDSQITESNPIYTATTYVTPEPAPLGGDTTGPTNDGTGTGPLNGAPPRGPAALFIAALTLIVLASDL